MTILAKSFHMALLTPKFPLLNEPHSAAKRSSEWETVVLHCRPQLLNLARNILHDQDDAQDAVQETIFKAYRSFDKIDFDKNPQPWLFRICQNCCTDALRRRTVEQNHLMLARSAFGHMRGPYTEVQNESVVDMGVYCAMNLLPHRSRQLLVQHHCEGKSIAELAELNHVPVGTIKCWLNRARAQLKKSFFIQSSV